MLAAAAVAVSLSLLGGGIVVAGKQPSVDGDRLEFALHDLDGAPVVSSDERFAGRVLLVTLWATWCPPCLTEIPTFNELQRELGDDGLTIVAIAFEEDEDVDARRARLREFGEAQGIDYLVLDGGTTATFEQALPAMRDVRGFPVEMLIDRTGTVRDARNGYGFKKKWAKRLRREIDELLAEGE